MDVCSVLQHRLLELGLVQKDLAAAAEVTESYISQLLTRKKSPPAPDRTDIYGKMEGFLKLPSGQLGKLADLQRRDELKRHLGEFPTPLYKEVRELILRKCAVLLLPFPGAVVGDWILCAEDAKSYTLTSTSSPSTFVS